MLTPVPALPPSFRIKLGSLNVLRKTVLRRGGFPTIRASPYSIAIAIRQQSEARLHRVDLIHAIIVLASTERA